MIKFLSLLLLSSTAFPQKDTITIHHPYYDICFDTLLRLPVYAVYTVYQYRLKSEVAKIDKFHYDELVARRYQWPSKRYSNSKYDRGHLSNDKVNRFNTKAQYDCMVMTNVAPQNRKFNQQLWRRVEECERDSARKYASVKSFTGCLYLGKVTVHGMRKPSHYYKVISAGGKFIAAWIASNRTPRSNDPRSILVSKHKIEKITGYTF
jgi:DNA/RNA endonuclease G (NUC1)